MQTPLPDEPRIAFIRAAIWLGPLEPAQALLAAHPELATGDIHTAAILGDDTAVLRFLEQDSTSATTTSPPYGADALTHLCFSKYLRLDPSRTPAFLRAAAALLDAGASANAGFFDTSHRPHPEWETALYGAAGVAHHPELTRLLLEHGADPNDAEAVYHSPESRDNRAMQLLVETNRLTPENLSLMLIRKHDWHDIEGARYLLEHGADPNYPHAPGWLAIHHALMRDNALRMFDLLLDHGADPLRQREGLTAIARAAREGRGDVLELLARRGVPQRLDGVDRLVAACARGDGAAVHALASDAPHLVAELLTMGGTLLAKFAGTGNPAGVRLLLDVGVDVAVPFAEGDGYWDEPPGSLAIHVASWRACHPVVRLLIERGSPLDTRDANGRTPLALAVRACVESYWMERRSPESVRALLAAGAAVAGAPFPSGYAEVDALLRQHGATPRT